MEDEDNIYDDVRRLVAVCPNKTQYDSKETVLFIYNKPLLENGGPYEVEFKGKQRCLTVPAFLLNSYTIETHAPVYYPAEKTTVTLYDKAKQHEPPIGECSFEFLSRSQVLEQALEKATDPENLLCEALGIPITDIKCIDEALARRIQDKFPNGFHLLNDQILQKSTRGGQSSTTHPTLIHFGAAHGLLQTVTVCLKVCPAAAKACALKNRDGVCPREIAEKCGHQELSEELQNFQSHRGVETHEDISIKIEDTMDTTEEEEDVYVEMDPVKKCDDELYEYLPMSPRDDIYDSVSGLSPELLKAISIAENAVSESWRNGILTKDTAKSFSQLLQKTARQDTSPPPLSPSPPRNLTAPALPQRLYLETKRHSIHDIPQSGPPLPPRSPISPRSPPFSWGPDPQASGRRGSAPNIVFTRPRANTNSNGFCENTPTSPLAMNHRPPPPTSPIPSRASRARSLDSSSMGLSPRLPPRRPHPIKHERSMTFDPAFKVLPGQRRRALSQTDELGYVTISYPK